MLLPRAVTGYSDRFIAVIHYGVQAIRRGIVEPRSKLRSTTMLFICRS